MRQTYERFCEVVGLPRIEPGQRVRGGIAVLAKTLPNAAGRDWRFVLRPDARVVAERLHAGATLLTQHRELSAALSPQWPDSVVGACKKGLRLLEQRRQTFAALGKPWTQDVIDTVKHGLALLDELLDTTKQLSVQYGDLVEQLNVNLLQREWVKAEKAVWPMSWCGNLVVESL